MKKDLVKQLLQKDNPVILEIGIATGEDSLGFLHQFPNVQLYCFEPDPRCIENHKSKVQDPRCKLYEVAISDVDGQAEFYQSSGHYDESQKGKDWLQSSSLKTPKNHLKVHPWCQFENKIIVQTQRLDTWAQENQIGDIDFIWADVQGAEENLIRGGLKTLARTQFFYTEYEDDELYEGQITLKQIEELLPDFKAIGYFGNNVLFQNTNFPDSNSNKIEPVLWQNWELFPPKVGLQFLKRRIKFYSKTLLNRR